MVFFRFHVTPLVSLLAHMFKGGLNLRQQLKRLENRAHWGESSRTVKSLLVSIVATVLLVGCGKQPAQKPVREKPAEPVAEVPAQQSSVATPSETVAEAPVQQSSVATPSETVAEAPVQQLPEVKPVEPVAPKNKPDEWATATGGNWDAATRGNTELIKQLLSDGMAVDVKDKEGLTGLYRAAHNDQKETVSLLLGGGANVNIRDKWGNTPLDVTLSDEIADLLRKHGGKTGEELKAAGN